MNLQEKIYNDLKEAMKSKDTIKLNVLRVVKSEIQRNEQNQSGKVVVSEESIIGIIKKLIDSIKQTTNNQTEIEVLSSYLPKQLSDVEMIDIVNNLKSNGSQIGDIMKYFKTNYSGQYDGKHLSELIKKN